MADLEVQRKRKTPWWIWLLTLILIAAIAYYFLYDRRQVTSTTAPATDTAISK